MRVQERSPIIFQFIDTVHQLMYQFPEALEFNEWFLLRLVDVMYSNIYSDFRFNNESEREASAAEIRPVSLWHLLLDGADREDSGEGGAIDGEMVPQEEFRNTLYDAARHPGAIKPPLNARIWIGYFNRWIEDPLTGRPSNLQGCRLPVSVSRHNSADETGGALKRTPSADINALPGPTMDFRSTWNSDRWVQHGIPSVCTRIILASDYWLVFCSVVDSLAAAPAATTAASRAGFLDHKARHQGWLFKEGKRNKKFQRRWFVLYDTPTGVKWLVYHEKEKTGSLVPKGAQYLSISWHIVIC